MRGPFLHFSLATCPEVPDGDLKIGFGKRGPWICLAVRPWVVSGNLDTKAEDAGSCYLENDNGPPRIADGLEIELPFPGGLERPGTWSVEMNLGGREATNIPPR
jgi:hypothetical protein